MQASVMINKNLNDIIDADILYTPEGVTDNSPNVHMTSTPVKNHCVYSQTYLMFNLKQLNVVLLQQSPDANPCKCVIAFGKRKTKRAFKNQ